MWRHRPKPSASDAERLGCRQRPCPCRRCRRRCRRRCCSPDACTPPCGVDASSEQLCGGALRLGRGRSDARHGGGLHACSSAEPASRNESHDSLSCCATDRKAKSRRATSSDVPGAPTAGWPSSRLMAKVSRTRRRQRGHHQSSSAAPALRSCAASAAGKHLMWYTRGHTSQHVSLPAWPHTKHSSSSGSSRTDCCPD